MKYPRPEQEKIIKSIRNYFRLKKEQNGTAIKSVKIIFRLKRKNKGIKHKVLRNIKNRINNFGSNNHIEYKSNGNKNIS